MRKNKIKNNRLDDIKSDESSQKNRAYIVNSTREINVYIYIYI